MARPGFVRGVGPGRWRIEILVQPGAKRNEVAGPMQERIKLRIAAKAVDNKANEALLAFLAERLGLRRGQLSLESGRASRKKGVLVEAAHEPHWEEAFPGCVG